MKTNWVTAGVFLLVLIGYMLVFTTIWLNTEDPIIKVFNPSGMMKTSRTTSPKTPIGLTDSSGAGTTARFKP
jgi:hypothetical protein